MSDHSKEWWRGAALYHIYPLSFADSNNDGWGDLQGIIAKLEYVSSLGVDGIWLSPFFESPLQDFGYDTTNHKGVDPLFGSLEDFDQLIEQAHALDLKVIVDQVYTYTSNRHHWFRDSRRLRNGKEDWYVWADAKPDGSPPNNWLAIFGGSAWEWDTVRGQYYMTHFMPAMPHLNVRNPDVQEALLDSSRFWLERGADGFRLDVINLAMVDPNLPDNPRVENVAAFLVPSQLQHLKYSGSLPENHAFIRRIRLLADEEPGRFLLGEVSSRDPMQTAREYSTGADRLNSAYFLLNAGCELLTANQLRTELEAWNDDDSWPTWAFSNHDSVRGPTRCGGSAPSPELARLLLAVLAMSRGTILIYQGDELGLPDADLPFQSLRDPASRRFYPDYLQRDGARTPMPWSGGSPNAGFSEATPWLPVPGVHCALAADMQEADDSSTLAWTRRLLDLRRREPAIRTGDIQFLASRDPLLAFKRSKAGSRLACVFNVSPKPTEWKPADAPVRKAKLASDASIGHDGGVELGPYGFACLEVE